MNIRLFALSSALIAVLLLSACVAVPVAETTPSAATEELVDASTTENNAEAETPATATNSDLVAEMPERLPAYDVELEGYAPLTSLPALFDIVEKTEETVTIRHLYGETTIPRNPQRIVTEMNTGEILISLGIIPVGYISPEDQGISPTLAEVAPNMVHLPVVDGPNYEQILALDPDLIIGSWMMGTGGDQAQYELLNAIAPTIPFNDWPGAYWQDSTRQVAMIFDLEEQAEVVIADYDAHVQEIRARIAPVFGDETVTPLLFFGPTAWLYTPREASNGRVSPEDSVGWLYHELALKPGEDILELVGGDETALGSPYLEITGELLPKITAEHLVVFPNGYSGAEGISEGFVDYQESPIWQNVPAVQEGNVYAITGVNKSRGYYTAKDNMQIFADIVTGERD